MQAKVLFVTEVDFWRSGTGGRSRSLHMLHYLSDKVDLTIVATGKRTPADDALIKRLKFGFNFAWLDCDSTLEIDQIEKFKTVIIDQTFTAAIFRSWNTAYFRKAVPAGVHTFIDVDDLRSELYETSIQLDINNWENISLAVECALYNDFDKVLLIQKEHVEKVSFFCDTAKIIFTPHHQLTKKHLVRKNVLKIGFIASGWEANRDGLFWFVEKVWPLVTANLTLDIYGLICGTLIGFETPRIRLMGYSTDLDATYGNIDVAINPVRYGSGLKIKTLEALGHGIPIVATSEGARGLHYLNGKAILIGDEPQTFANHINHLISDFEMRKNMSDAGLAYVRDCCSPHFCYSGIMKAIENFDREKNATSE
jgi:hypothetical protein